MLKYLLVLITSSLILISCGDKNNGPEKNLTEKEKYAYDSTDLKTEGMDTSGKPFLMEYKFKKGDKIMYRLTTISNNLQTIKMDTTISSGVNQKIIYILDLLVKEVDEDGSTEAEINFNSIKLEAAANGQTFNFEAGKDLDSAKIHQFAEYQALYNNPFSARFSKKGDILEVYKADKISNKFLELKGAADTISVNDRNLIRQDLINGVLTPLITQIIRKLSDKEVYKDSTWQIQQAPIPLMVYQINYTNTYKVESVEKLEDDRVAVINAGIDFKYSGQSKVNQGNVFYNFEKPKSTAEGKIYFDVDRGIQIKSRTKTRLEISYTMEANTPQGKQKGARSDVITNTNILELL
ncbi:MAG TPA: DUF6263 family protein [Ignavibacteriaceae bacterium]